MTYGEEKGVRTQLCAAPSGPVQQMSPDPFFLVHGRNLEAVCVPNSIGTFLFFAPGMNQPPSTRAKKRNVLLSVAAHTTFSTFPLLTDRASACTIFMVVSVEAIGQSAGLAPLETQSTR